MISAGALTKLASAAALVLSISAASSCNRNNTQSATKSTTKVREGIMAPVIEFRRTPCFGTCPIYRATVLQDGTIHYNGERFIDKIGKFEASLPPAEVAMYVAEAREANFFKSDTLYVTGATDFPSQILTIRDQGKSHTIRTEGEGPKEVELLMQRIDQAILHAVRTNGQPVKQ